MYAVRRDGRTEWLMGIVAHSLTSHSVSSCTLGADSGVDSDADSDID